MNDEKTVNGLSDVSDDDIIKKRISKKRKRILIILFVMLNIATIAAAAYVDFAKDILPDVPYSIDIRYLFPAVWCLAVLIASESMNYYVMLRRFSSSASVRTAFEVMALGRYYNNITPTGAGGQPFQMYYLRKIGISAGASAAMPVAGFLAMQIVFIALAITVFIFGTPFLAGIAGYSIAVMISAYIGIVFYAAVPTLILMFVIFPKAAKGIVRFVITLLGKLRIVKKPGDMLGKAIGVFTEYRDSVVAICKMKTLFFTLLGFSLVCHIAMCSIPFFVLKAFGSPLSYLSVVAMMVLIYCAITYIPTPGNSGAAEISFFVLLASLNHGNLFWAMMIWRFLTYYVFLLIGGCLFAFKAVEKRLGRQQGTG